MPEELNPAATKKFLTSGASPNMYCTTSRGRRLPIG
jgi:hypothetical protein